MSTTGSMPGTVRFMKHKAGNFRNIDIDGAVWRWKVGHSFVEIRDPDGKGYRPARDEISGYDFMTAAPKGEAECITPGLIRKYIEGLPA